MGVNYFSLDGVRSTAYGVLISGPGVDDAPGRAYESVYVAGKNGAVLFDEGRYDNAAVYYEAGLINKGGNLDNFRAWLLSHTKYCRLTDSYHPGEYRLAIPKGGLKVQSRVSRKVGTFRVDFDCKPQRFLLSGEATTTLTASGAITNPTLFAAKPLIRIYGYGALGIGSETVTIAQHPGLGYIDMDCEAQDSICGNSNANEFITLTGSDYPTLSPGANNISLAGTLTRIIITPRWWTL